MTDSCNFDPVINMMSEISKNHAVMDAISAHLEKLKILCPGLIYSYAVINKKDPSEIIIISNKPNWFDEYVKNSYQLIDPVTMRALNDMGDFLWERGSEEITRTQLHNVFRMSEMVHIDAGHTFILHDPRNNVATLSFMCELASYGNLIRLMNEHKNLIQSFLVSTHKMTLSLYDKLVKKFDMEVTLTPREIELLTLTSKGKKYSEAAKFLGITVSTVKFHMGRVNRKLGAKNTPHAIKLAVELNLISTDN